MIQVCHYRAKCIGCNACVEINRERWRMSMRDGKSTLVGGSENKGIYSVNVDSDEIESVMAAVKNCPMKIIGFKKTA